MVLRLGEMLFTVLLVLVPGEIRLREMMLLRETLVGKTLIRTVMIIIQREMRWKLVRRKRYWANFQRRLVRDSIFGHHERRLILSSILGAFVR